MAWLKRIVLTLLVVGVAAFAFVFGFAAKLHDGPIGPIAGGALVAGEETPSETFAWESLHAVGEIQMQLLQPPRSRTVWVAVHEGAAYIPCGFLNVPLWKQWPYAALEDGRAVIRVGGEIKPADGKKLAVQLVRVEDAAIREAVGKEVARKYNLPGDGNADEDSVWIFRVEPRA